MSDEFDSDEQESEGGGLRRQLEQMQTKLKEAGAARQRSGQRSRNKGRTQAQRRYQALEVFGKDRPGLADAWVDKNPEGELTPEVAKEFALPTASRWAEHDLPSQPGASSRRGQAGSRGVPTPIAAVPPVAQTYTPEEIRKIGVKNQAEALRLIEQGIDEDPRIEGTDGIRKQPPPPRPTRCSHPG